MNEFFNRFIRHLIFPILLTATLLQGQSVDFRNDQAFFDQRIPVFEQWLNNSGLSMALSVENLAVDSQLVRLTLQFHYADPDTASSAWLKLKEDFQQQAGFSLEDRLFYKLATVLEVPFNHLELGFINFPSRGELPVLDFTLYFDPQSSTVSKRGFFRGPPVEGSIIIPFYELETDDICSTHFSFNEAFGEKERRQLNRQMGERLVHFYRQKTDDKHVSPYSWDPVVIEVMNIKSEVIPAGLVSFTNPNERLMVNLCFDLNDEGLLVLCTIDGQIGNGLFRPRVVKGFRDMTPDYQDELIRYTNQLILEQLDPWVREFLNK